jgi:hypothetical protein
MIVALSGQLCGTLLIISLISAFVIRRRAAPLPGDALTRLDGRLSEIQQSIDAVAVEVERISEGQRFTTKLLAERGIAGAEVNDVRAAARGTPVR